jgi:hypothetical protein
MTQQNRKMKNRRFGNVIFRSPKHDIHTVMGDFNAKVGEEEVENCSLHGETNDKNLDDRFCNGHEHGSQYYTVPT